MNIWISFMPEILSCNVAFSSARLLWAARKVGTYLLHENPASQIRNGTGISVRSARYTFRKNRMTVTPATMRDICQQIGDGVGE